MARDARIRRSPFLVTYWDDDAHWVHSYLTRKRQQCGALALAILDKAGEWTKRESLYGLPSASAADVERTIDELVSDGLLDCPDCTPSPAAKALAEWGGWNPAAGFFHAETRTMGPVPRETDQPQRPFLRLRDFPPALKHYPDHPRTELPAGEGAGPLQDLLHRRRTWREFGEGQLSLDEASTLLRQTFGVQRWLNLGDDFEVALKSSPSGGARHSIEAYLLAFGIDGIANGTYHYCPDTHALSQLRSETAKALAKEFLPTQKGFHDPSALIVMTSVFDRMHAKYPHPHAYKVVLLDAGHLGQTFALMATALGLAPFCTAHVNAPRIEEHLGIDGISESVVLVLGVGSRPADKPWAPAHDHGWPPATRPPSWSSRIPAPPFP